MLEKISLESLSKTRLAEQFDEAVSIVRESLGKDGDVKGARKITITLAFVPDDRGFVAQEGSVTTSTPKRKVKSVAALENGVLKIDTISNDARQPSLLEEAGKVTPIRREGGQ